MQAVASSQLDKEMWLVLGYCISSPHLNFPISQLSPLSVLFSSQPAGVFFFCFIFLFVCNAYLAFPSCLCVHFSFPGLASGLRRRRRRRKRSSQSRSPIQRKRKMTMPPVRARTGTEGWTLPGSHQKPGVSFLRDSLQPPFSSRLPSSLAPTGKRLHRATE